MIKVAVFAGGQLADFSTGFDVYVGVDRGSLFLIENQLPLDLAVGDFDSVSQDELQLIKKQRKLLFKHVLKRMILILNLL